MDPVIGTWWNQQWLKEQANGKLCSKLESTCTPKVIFLRFCSYYRIWSEFSADKHTLAKLIIFQLKIQQNESRFCPEMFASFYCHMKTIEVGSNTQFTVHFVFYLLWAMQFNFLQDRPSLIIFGRITLILINCKISYNRNMQFNAYSPLALPGVH